MLPVGQLQPSLGEDTWFSLVNSEMDSAASSQHIAGMASGNRSLGRYVEVAVVGAGPAGCAAAYTLGRAGVEVAVFEGGLQGKDKTCGDALVSSAVELLGRYGVSQQRLADLGGYPFSRIDTQEEGISTWQGRPETSTGWVIRRAVLDQELRDLCSEYAPIHYGTVVEDVAVGPDGTQTLTLKQRDGSRREAYCGATVLANGAGSRLSRGAGVSGNPIMAASIRGYATMARLPEVPFFQFSKRYQPGYAWVFPLTSDQVNMGVCALSSVTGRRLRYLAAEHSANWFVSEVPKWKGGPQALWSGQGRVWHHAAGIVSCGDAAGLASPFSGEGITGALASGERAALAVAHFLGENRCPDHLLEYSTWVSAYFHQAHRITEPVRAWGLMVGLIDSTG